MSLFVVERRLPKIDDHQLMVLQSALTNTTSRFSARGDGVQLLGSLFLAGQGRLLSLFRAGSAEAVRAVSEASLIPFASVEPAVGLPGAGGPQPLHLGIAAAYPSLIWGIGPASRGGPTCPPS
jgi:hypothetical protein